MTSGRVGAVDRALGDDLDLARQAGAQRSERDCLVRAQAADQLTELSDARNRRPDARRRAT